MCLTIFHLCPEAQPWSDRRYDIRPSQSEDGPQRTHWHSQYPFLLLSPVYSLKPVQTKSVMSISHCHSSQKHHSYVHHPLPLRHPLLQLPSDPPQSVPMWTVPEDPYNRPHPDSDPVSISYPGRWPWYLPEKQHPMLQSEEWTHIYWVYTLSLWKNLCLLHFS